MITIVLSKIPFITSFQKVFCVFLNKEISYLYNSTIFRMLLIVSIFFVNSIIWKSFPKREILKIEDNAINKKDRYY